MTNATSAPWSRASFEDEGHAPRRAHNSTEAIDAVRQRRPALVILDVSLQGGRARWLAAARRDPREDRRSGGDVGGHAPSIPRFRRSSRLRLHRKASSRPIVFCSSSIEPSRPTGRGVRMPACAGGPAVRSDFRRLIGGGCRRAHADRAGSPDQQPAAAGHRRLGTGKETVARLIHQGSKRAPTAVRRDLLSTLPAERLELELFGTDGGRQRFAARVGRSRAGAWRHTGLRGRSAIFPFALQSRLARVLQDDPTRPTPADAGQVDLRCSLRQRGCCRTRSLPAGSVRSCSIA